MHEMSIVTGILNIALDHARKAGAAVIQSIEIEVGQFSGVEISALEFAYEVASKQADLASTRLVIHEVAGQCECIACGRVSDQAALVQGCPGCGEFKLQVIQGKELRVRSITVD